MIFSIRKMLFSCLVVVSSMFSGALGTTTETQLLLNFQNYMIEFNKTYQHLSQEDPLKAKRFKAYKMNLARVQDHNLKYENGESTFTLAMNEIADLTDDEYKSLLGYKSTRKQAQNAPSEAEILQSFKANDEAPDTWDWREHDVVAPVKNQGMCGSCWAFSAVASMECVNARATGKLVSLSEQELVDCVKGGADTCTTGGEMQDGFQEIIDHHSGKIDTAEDYSYTAASKGVCKAHDESGIGHFTSYANVTSGDEEALKTAVAKNCVVSIAIDASSFLFQLYHHGVFNWPLCKNTIDDLDHGVALVGYGTFRENSPFWLVKNSWGQTWGMQGYIMMSRNKKNQCGVATDGSYPIMSKSLNILDNLSTIV